MRVRDNIRENCGGLPIISISQFPVDFGDNICVGDHGCSGFNMFRQVQIGLRKAKTKFVISAEADCLYPQDYFEFRPPEDDIAYRNTNTWVMPQWRPFFWNKPGGATHAQIIGREFYLDRLTELFEGAPDWSVEEKNFPKERKLGSDVFTEDQIKYWATENPVVQIKTTRSMRHFTESKREDTHKLPYWGKGVDFRNKYYGDN